jgi:hypothetical protein
MSKARHIVGIITALLLVLSSGAHSFLGWKSMRERLVAANAPEDLVTGLAMGWQFAGVAMLIFGLMSIGVFVSRLRGREAPLWIPRLIAITYTLYGLASYQISKDNFFLTIFVVPGVLLSLSAWGSDAEPE